MPCPGRKPDTPRPGRTPDTLRTGHKADMPRPGRKADMPRSDCEPRSFPHNPIRFLLNRLHISISVSVKYRRDNRSGAEPGVLQKRHRPTEAPSNRRTPVRRDGAFSGGRCGAGRRRALRPPGWRRGCVRAHGRRRASAMIHCSCPLIERNSSAAHPSSASMVAASMRSTKLLLLFSLAIGS